MKTFRSSSVIGPVCSGGSAGEGEMEGDGTSSGSSALPRDQSSSVVSLGTPSLPVGPLSLTERRISGSWLTVGEGSSHRSATASTSDAELENYRKPISTKISANRFWNFFALSQNSYQLPYSPNIPHKLFTLI